MEYVGFWVSVDHSYDVLYGFDGLHELATIIGKDPNDVPGQDIQLGQTMAAYWVSFAKNGDPNPEGDTTNETAVVWPKFTTEGDTILRLDVKSGAGVHKQEALRKVACDWQIEKALA